MVALVIHGGLNNRDAFEKNRAAYSASMQKIITAGFEYLKGHRALETAIFVTKMLEDDPILNAGTGSVIQSDGIIRMSASIMDGSKKIFSGVINIEKVQNPISIAASLQAENDRVLAGAEANLFAKKIGVPEFDTQTEARRNEFEEKKNNARPTSTVGCVALDAGGNLAAATSTGGKGWEIPGRVGDSPTVAGNYANAHCAVSCTGTGEDIISVTLASAFVTRVSEGAPMDYAAHKAIEELTEINGSAGFIALNKNGEIITAATQPHMVWALANNEGVEIFT